MNGYNLQISIILSKRIWRLSCWPAKYRYDHHHQSCRQIASKGMKKTLWSNTFGQLWSNSTSQTHNGVEVEQLLNTAGKVYCFRIIGVCFCFMIPFWEENDETNQIHFFATMYDNLGIRGCLEGQNCIFI